MSCPKCGNRATLPRVDRVPGSAIPDWWCRTCDHSWSSPRRVPLSYWSAADELGLNDDEDAR